MARRCDCARLLDALETDPRLQLMPLAARMVWLELVRAMQRLGGSVLRLGSEIPNRDKIAMLLRTTTTELEPNLNLLIGAGLIELERDGALRSPLLALALARSETARLNGLKAGEVHRRKREAREREADLARQQGKILLPVAGGRATETEPNTEPVAATPTTTYFSSKSEKSVSSTAGSEFERIGHLVIDAVGLDPARWLGTYGIVQDWLDAGATEAVILAAVRRLMSRPKAPRPSEIKKLSYFTDAILDDVKAARAEIDCRPNLAWRAAVDAWQAAGCRGEMPCLESFRAAGAA